jgi:hypothetical protein
MMALEYTRCWMIWRLAANFNGVSVNAAYRIRSDNLEDAFAVVYIRLRTKKAGYRTLTRLFTNEHSLDDLRDSIRRAFEYTPLDPFALPEPFPFTEQTCFMRGKQVSSAAVVINAEVEGVVSVLEDGVLGDSIVDARYTSWYYVLCTRKGGKTIGVVTDGEGYYLSWPAPPGSTRRIITTNHDDRRLNFQLCCTDRDLIREAIRLWIAG